MYCCLRNRRPDLGNLAADLVVQTKVLKGCRIDDCGETRSVLEGGGGGGFETRGPPMSSEAPHPTPGKRDSELFLYMGAKY